ncbi:MAG: DUF2920 family protein [Pseudomonadota bacterium]
MSSHRIRISAHHDFEFLTKIKRSIEYSLVIPEGDIKGLVVYIPGFGDDSGPYREKFLQHVADDYSLAGLTVDYHCFFSRPGNGATLSIETGTMNLLRSLTGLTNNESIDEVLSQACKIKTGPGPLRIPGIIYPKNNDYQNFGVLPALDIIFAINDLFQKFPDIPKIIYAIGSSYGGYIANLVSKFAPCTLNAVFDNSSWASPNLQYVVGHDLGLTELSCNYSSGVVIEANVLSPWSHLLFMPNAFNRNRSLIRSFPESHLDVMGKIGKGKTIYRCVHAENDIIANTDQKLTLIQNMNTKGFDARITIYSEADIDGKFIKNMDHGMGLSMRQFFSNSLENIQGRIKDDQRIDFDFKHTLEFACESQKYIITYPGGAQPLCCVRQ